MTFYLAIDTSTDACSAATFVDGQVAERFEPMQRDHTRRLLPMIHAVLADSGRALSQLDGLVCGIGPGSFAGLRIGVGVTKGLALARDLPVVGVSSLAMIAQRAFADGAATQVAACIDAKMSEVYFAAYRRGEGGLAETVIGDCACLPGAAPRLPAGPWRAMGSGWAAHEGVLRGAADGTISGMDATALPHAREALALALPRFAAGEVLSADALAPAYLRDRVALTVAEQAARRGIE